MHGCNVPHQNFHRSTFSFSESRTAFSFVVQKKKWFWPQPGRQKKQLQVKNIPLFPQKKAVLPASSVRRRSRQRLGCGPPGQAKKQPQRKNTLPSLNRPLPLNHQIIQSCNMLSHHRPESAETPLLEHTSPATFYPDTSSKINHPSPLTAIY